MLTGASSNALLLRLRDVMADSQSGDDRLNRIVALIAESLGTEVCSIYLGRPDGQYELYATYGLESAAIHKTIMGAREGLVGRVAYEAKVINTADAQNERGFSYRPETGEDRYRGFAGVPIQRVGKVLGVLVVQTEAARMISPAEISALEFVAIVLAEMAEIGAFVTKDGAPIAIKNTGPMSYKGIIGQEGVARGEVVLHNPRVVIENPVTDDPEKEIERLGVAYQKLQQDLRALGRRTRNEDDETNEILSVFEGFARDQGFRRRLEGDINGGLSAEAAVEMEQSRVRARMSKIADPYLRSRMSDIDDFANRLLRSLVGAARPNAGELPEKSILVARNIGPAELLEYGRSLRGIVLGEGAVGSHAAIIARTWGIPLIIQAKNITLDANQGDPILVDGETGEVHLRPSEDISEAFTGKITINNAARAAYSELRDLEAVTKDGVRITLMMNAGLMADLPSLVPSGAEGVGLFRTELQFLTQSTIPTRTELAETYARVMSAAAGKPVLFRTLDIGSDKVVEAFNQGDEPNPAMGWRAIRLGLDRRNILKMQIQAFLRAANGRRLDVMFPFVAKTAEFYAAKEVFLEAVAFHEKFGHPLPETLNIGAMLETPSLAYAPDSFFQDVDFISVGGNDLKQFFFAADRENEKVRRRYETIDSSYMAFMRHIAQRCTAHGVSFSFCGEDAGKPLEALALCAMGFRNISMRPISVGMVKNLIRQVDMSDLSATLNQAIDSGVDDLRQVLQDYLTANDITLTPRQPTLH